MSEFQNWNDSTRQHNSRSKPSASQTRLIIALSLPLLKSMGVALALLQVWFYDEECFLDDPGRSSLLPGAVRSRFIGLCPQAPHSRGTCTSPSRGCLGARLYLRPLVSGSAPTCCVVTSNCKICRPRGKRCQMGCNFCQFQAERYPNILTVDGHRR
jgi:hypothetical protein